MLETRISLMLSHLNSGLMGKTDIENAKIDMLSGCLEDVMMSRVIDIVYFSTDETRVCILSYLDADTWKVYNNCKEIISCTFCYYVSNSTYIIICAIVNSQ